MQTAAGFLNEFSLGEHSYKL